MLSRERAPTVNLVDVDRSEYTLHAKPQTTVPINLERVTELALKSPDEIRHGWLAAHRFLCDDDGLHSSVPWNGVVRQAQLRPDDIGRLLSIGNVTSVPRRQRNRVRGTIRLFLVPEDAKRRFRVIKHTVDYNNRYGRETLWPSTNATKRSARSAILRGDGAIVIDLAAFFDQILLSNAASWCQAFKVGNRLYRNLRLPMGGRHSTCIGTALIRVLLAFDMPDVAVDWATDAARFVGPREAVIDAAWEFVQRCRHVGAKANESGLVSNCRI